MPVFRGLCSADTRSWESNAHEGGPPTMLASAPRSLANTGYERTPATALAAPRSLTNNFYPTSNVYSTPHEDQQFQYQDFHSPTGPVAATPIQLASDVPQESLYNYPEATDSLYSALPAADLYSLPDTPGASKDVDYLETL